jgi:hypothetical protein
MLLSVTGRTQPLDAQGLRIVLVVSVDCALLGTELASIGLSKLLPSKGPLHRYMGRKLQPIQTTPLCRISSYTGSVGLSVGTLVLTVCFSMFFYPALTPLTADAGVTAVVVSTVLVLTAFALRLYPRLVT